MKMNLPVFDAGIPYPTGKVLVSKTDLKGVKLLMIPLLL